MPKAPSPPPVRSERPASERLLSYPPAMERSPDTSPIGDALAWSSRIIAIGLFMFLPGVAGGWLDARLGLGFLGPAGFILGFTAALAWLVQIGTARRRREERGP